ncbi:hypothetical protein GCM10020220_097780 [Nonomuraea rubra]
MVRRRLAFDTGPEAFAARWAGEEAALARRIASARGRVAEVRLPDARLRQIATVCAAFEVDGLRADLVTANAALAHAAWQGRDSVTTEDVRAAARLSLPHRRRRDPFDAPGLDEALLDELLERTSGDDDDPDGPDGPDGGPGRASGPDGEPGRPSGPDGGPGRPSGADDGPGRAPGPDGGWSDAAGDQAGDAHRQGAGQGDREDDGRREHTRGQADDRRWPGSGTPDTAWDAAQADGGVTERTGGGAREIGGGETGTGEGRGGEGGSRVAGVARPYRVPLLEVPGIGEGAAGRRSRSRASQGRGTGARRPSGRVRDLHVAATMRAAAPYQRERGRSGAGLVLRGGRPARGGA